MTPTVQTPRFLLRPVELSDASGLYALDSSPEVIRYLGLPPAQSIQEAEETVRYIQGQYEKHGIGRWAVIEKDTGAFVGWSGLKYEEHVRDYGYYDLGYRLLPAYWGQGIATETAIASLQYGFETMKLEKICAGAHVDNAASNRVLQKVGMQRVEAFTFDGMPHYWYEITG